MNTAKSANKTALASAVPAESAASAASAAPTVPFPIPVGTPPGGGRWTWDTAVGKWVSLDPPPADPEPADPEPAAS